MGINPVLQTGLLNQSSAQVIDGSLKFDKDKTTHLKEHLVQVMLKHGLGVVGLKELILIVVEISIESLDKVKQIIFSSTKMIYILMQEVLVMHV